jgi:hypothetical protein
MRSLFPDPTDRHPSESSSGIAYAKVVLKLIQDCDDSEKDVETILNKTTFD